MTTYRVVEHLQGSLPITVDALPEDVIQGEKMGKLLQIAIGKFRRNGKVTIETKALGPIVFWETRSRSRRGGVIKHTYHMQFTELKLAFNSPGYHDFRRWLAIGCQYAGMGYPCIVASFDGSGVEFHAANGQAMDAGSASS